MCPTALLPCCIIFYSFRVFYCYCNNVAKRDEQLVLSAKRTPSEFA